MPTGWPLAFPTAEVAALIAAVASVHARKYLSLATSKLAMPGLIDIGGQQIDPAAQLLDLDRADCEDSLYVFLRSAWRTFDSAPWVDGWCIEAIAEHLQAVIDGQLKRLIINIPPRCSKPVSADSSIFTQQRGIIPLRDVTPGTKVLTHTGKFKTVLQVHRQGMLSVLKLTTRSGRQIVAAPDHPLLTPNGWMKLKDLNHQDIVGIIPQYETSGTKTVSEECARLLGYLIGDGHCIATPRITVADDIEAADIRHCISSVGFYPSDKEYRMANTGYMLRTISIRSSSVGKEWRTGGVIGPVRKWLIDHGLYLKSSYDKKIPNCIMQGDNLSVTNFIGAFWACDGFVSTKGVKRDGTERVDLHIGCDSVNFEFIQQMQLLLLRIGISSLIRKKVCKIKTKKQGDIYTSYTLSISDQDNCWRFASAIKIMHTKGIKLENARKRRFDFDQTVRGEVVEEIIPHGQAECICLTVDEDHSFVANGFAVHNSAICSVALTAWTWAQATESHTSGPGVSFLYASFKDNLVTRDSRKCRQVIESRWYQSLWGTRFSLTSDQNTKSRFANDKGGERLTTSVEDKGATGEGANVIILDDCNSAKQVESEAVIESTLDWFDGTMRTRLNNQKLGAFVNIQQRVGENDVTGHILSKNKGEWTHLCLPMEYEPDRAFMTPIGWIDPRAAPGDLLWPERFGPEEVASLKEDMGEWRAAGQLQQRPAPRGGGIIKREYWQLWGEEHYPQMDYICATVDTAYTAKTQNDQSALIVWGIFSGAGAAQTTRRIGKDGRLTWDERIYMEESPKVMMMYAWAGHLEFQPLVDKVAGLAKTFKVHNLLIENKASGISIAQEVRRLYANERFGLQFFDPKSLDKFARLVSVQHLFQEKLIYAPDREWAEMVMTQCGQFPRGKRDDLVDCVSMGIRHLRDTGLLTRAPERRAELETMQAYPERYVPLYPA